MHFRILSTQNWLGFHHRLYTDNFTPYFISYANPHQGYYLITSPPFNKSSHPKYHSSMTIELLPADQERAKIFKALSEAKF